MESSWHSCVFGVSPIPVLHLDKRAAFSVCLLYSRLYLLPAEEWLAVVGGNRYFFSELQTHASGVHRSYAACHTAMENIFRPGYRCGNACSGLASLGRC